MQAVSVGPSAEHGATAAGSSGLPAAQLRALRVLRTRPDRQLVEGPQRLLRVLPLPPRLPRRERHQGEARVALRRRTRPAAAVTRLHAAAEGVRAADLEGDARRRSARTWRMPSARAKAIQEKLDRLDEAFLFERSIDIDVYDRHAEKLREELTLAADRPSFRRSSTNST